MRRIRSTRVSRKTTWRVRAVQLALALGGTGLMTAIAVAAIGASPSDTSDRAMAAAIVAQRIAEGEAATPAATAPTEPTEPPADSPADAVTRAKILAEAATYEADMKQSVAHADQLRIEAYHDKDLIRMNFITSKLDDMKQIMVITEAALAVMRQPGQDIFVMRAKLTTIRQGAERVKQAMAAAEAAAGDTAEAVAAVGTSNSEANPSADVTDPTNPPSPSVDVERPSAASPYR
jgi:hypothetical protein